MTVIKFSTDDKKWFDTVVEFCGDVSLKSLEKDWREVYDFVVYIEFSFDKLFNFLEKKVEFTYSRELNSIQI